MVRKWAKKMKVAEIFDGIQNKEKIVDVIMPLFMKPPILPGSTCPREKAVLHCPGHLREVGD